ncbi:hypothetical protein MVEN_02406400 [Mycena venus]|uniref:Uncharacterized protein n=1 Tax=Mycena venus TaxID=2733690 RepID=A0A8H6X2R9_9AGAR|nr:hypothetical protein MVEN_02406400 [Mycena venus]
MRTRSTEKLRGGPDEQQSARESVEPLSSARPTRVTRVTRAKGSENKNLRSEYPKELSGPTATGSARATLTGSNGSTNDSPEPREMQLRPHPCTFSPPEKTGITCVLYTFLVDELPQNYPYLLFLSSSNHWANHQFQIPFFCFSGPDPPPADIGSPGDIYVAPAASALYAYLPSEDDLFEDGIWTRWNAVRPSNDFFELQPGDHDLLQHPHFPGRLLWANSASFSWYKLDTVNRVLGEALQKKLFAGNEDPAAAAKILVEHTLQIQSGEYKVSKRRQNDEETETRKKRRVAKPKKDMMAPVSDLETENAGLKASIDQLRRLHAAEVASLRMSLDTRLREQVDTRLRKQTATISSLTEENAELRTSFAARSATITRLDEERAALTATAEEVLRENTALKTTLATSTMHTAQLEATLAREREDSAQRNMQHKASLHAAESTIRGLKDTAKVLLAEVDRVNDTAAQDAKLAEVRISEQQSKIVTLEAEIARLTRAT